MLISRPCFFVQEEEKCYQILVSKYPLKFFKFFQTMFFLYHVWIIKLSLVLSIYRKKYDTQNK